MKNILILAALSAVILTGCGNISPPFKAEQTTVTTAAPTVSAAASSEAESTVDEEQVKYDNFERLKRRRYDRCSVCRFKSE